MRHQITCCSAATTAFLALGIIKLDVVASFQNANPRIVPRSYGWKEEQVWSFVSSIPLASTKDNIETPRVIQATPTEVVGDSNSNVTQTPRKRKKKRKFPSRRMRTFSFLNLPQYEIATASAVVLSSFLVAIDTLDDLGTVLQIDAHSIIHDTLAILDIAFAVDFFVRWYAAGNFKKNYLRKPLVVLDIVVVLIPLVFATLIPEIESLLGMASSAPTNSMTTTTSTGWVVLENAGLQNLLLLRILRLRRVLTDTHTFGRFQRALGIARGPSDVKPYQLQLARVILSLFTLVSVSSGLIYTAEHQVNPQFPDYFAALYFGLTTLTTVGFGDITPITSEGRTIVCLSILAGVAVIPAQTANLVDAILEFSEERKKSGPRVTISAPPKVSSTALREQRQQRLNGSNSNSKAEASTPNEEENQMKPQFTTKCSHCQATDHRKDASFCWSCGTKL